MTFSAMPDGSLQGTFSSCLSEKVVRPAKTGPAGPLATAMLYHVGQVGLSMGIPDPTRANYLHCPYLVDNLSYLGDCGLECLSTSTSVNCTEVPPPRACMISPCKGKEGGGRVHEYPPILYTGMCMHAAPVCYNVLYKVWVMHTSLLSCTNCTTEKFW